VRFAATATTATIAGLALGACGFRTGPEPVEVTAARTVAPERVDAFTIAVRQLGCTLDFMDHDPMYAAGFTDDEMTSIGLQLVAEGRAHVNEEGDLVLDTEGCV
jgi:hypothetical protein